MACNTIYIAHLSLWGSNRMLSCSKNDVFCQFPPLSLQFPILKPSSFPSSFLCEFSDDNYSALPVISWQSLSMTKFNVELEYCHPKWVTSQEWCHLTKHHETSKLAPEEKQHICTFSPRWHRPPTLSLKKRLDLRSWQCARQDDITIGVFAKGLRRLKQ